MAITLSSNCRSDLFELKGFARHIVILRGGRSAKERRDVQEQLTSIPIGEERLLLATGKYIGEGFDDARQTTYWLSIYGVSRRGCRGSVEVAVRPPEDILPVALRISVRHMHGTTHFSILE